VLDRVEPELLDLATQQALERLGDASRLPGSG
jgi:hypothetical protein